VARCLLLIACFEVGISVGSFDAMLYGLLIVELGYLVLLLCGRPYVGLLSNASLLCNQLASLFCFALPLLARFVSLAETTQLLVLLVLEGLLALCILLSAIRLFLVYLSLARGALFRKEVSKIEEIPAEKRRRGTQKSEGER
jgi:hypothetical protein